MDKKTINRVLYGSIYYSPDTKKEIAVDDDYKLLIDLHKQGYRQGPGGDNEYPEIDVASAKIRILEKHGYSPVGYFALPEHCWLDQYYRPMQARLEDFLNRNGNSEEARAVVAADQQEIDLYETYKAHISYGVYVAKKTQ